MRLIVLVRFVLYITRKISKVIAKVLEKLRYQGIGLANSANLDIHGDFSYGHGCGIGEGANIIIPQRASLNLGDSCYIGRYVEIGPGGCIEIGSDTSIQDRCILLGDVKIGRYCLFALNIYISSGRHYFDLKPNWLIKDQDRLIACDKKLKSSHSKPIVVEDDCWLGVNVVVMPGVTIGKGAVIGANSVVTQDIFPYTVVAGAPAKEVKKRLNFVPPQRILYKNPNDWPYFYAGFEISQALMEKNSAYEGLVTKDEFTFCLDASLGNSVRLIVRCIALQMCTLTFGNQTKEISNQFEEVVFENNDHARKTLRFHMQTEKSTDQLIVKEVWVK